MELAVIQMTENRLREHLTHAAQLGAHLALQQAGLPVREYFTRTELNRKYGAALINSLIKKDRLTPHRLDRNDTQKRIVYAETEVLQNII